MKPGIRFAHKTTIFRLPVGAVLIAALLTCFGMGGRTAAQEPPEEEPNPNIYLKSFEPVKTPVIEHNTFYYYADLKFSNAPVFFWIYYDSLHKSLILNCPDVIIKNSDKISSHHILFKSLSVRTEPSKMSLFQQQSDIVIGLEHGWNYKASLQNETVIRIMIWKEMQVIQRRQNYSMIVWGIVASSVLGALIITITLLSAG